MFPEEAQACQMFQYLFNSVCLSSWQVEEESESLNESLAKLIRWIGTYCQWKVTLDYSMNAAFELRLKTLTGIC